MSLAKRLRLFLVFSTVVFGLAGCGGRSPEARFYLLPSEPVPEVMDTSQASPPIGVVLAEFPEYLDRPQIVTRVDTHQLEFAELHRWSEPLKKTLLAELTERLRWRLNTEAVWAVPFPPYAHPAYKVALELSRLDGTLGGNASLEARWVLSDISEDRVLTLKRTILTEAVSGPGYEGLVAAESRLISRLADEIAKEVKGLR